MLGVDAPSAGRGEAVAEPPVTFAGLLRKLRTEARLTQEELAEATGLSPRSISDLERGIAATPCRETVRLLADGLHLVGSARPGPRYRQLLGRGARTGRPGPLRPGRRPRDAGRGPPAAGTGDIPTARRSRGPGSARRRTSSLHWSGCQYASSIPIVPGLEHLPRLPHPLAQLCCEFSG